MRGEDRGEERREVKGWDGIRRKRLEKKKVRVCTRKAAHPCVRSRRDECWRTCIVTLPMDRRRHAVRAMPHIRHAILEVICRIQFFKSQLHYILNAFPAVGSSPAATSPAACKVSPSTYAPDSFAVSGTTYAASLSPPEVAAAS